VSLRAGHARRAVAQRATSFAHVFKRLDIGTGSAHRLPKFGPAIAGADHRHARGGRRGGAAGGFSVVLTECGGYGGSLGRAFEAGFLTGACADRVLAAFAVAGRSGGDSSPRISAAEL